MAVRAVLNKYLWDPKENIADYELTFIHRGAPMDLKTIPCSLISHVEISGFAYKGDGEDEVFIPFHRVLEIRNVRTGHVSWKRRGRTS